MSRARDWQWSKRLLAKGGRRAAKHLKKQAHRQWRRAPIEETPNCRLNAWNLV